MNYVECKANQEFAVEETDITIPKGAVVLVDIESFDSLEEALDSAILSVKLEDGSYTLLYPREIKKYLSW